MVKKILKKLKKKKKKSLGIEKIEYLGKEGIPYVGAEGNSVERDVGSWRVFKPVIDKSKCIKCRRCWISCPESAITFDKDGKPVIDYSICKGCLVCAENCPVKCIKKVRETHE